jgi:hypothetical protein
MFVNFRWRGLQNFVYLDAGMLLAECLRSQIRAGSLASGNSAFICETLHSQFCIRSYNFFLQFARKTPLTAYSPETCLAGGRTALQEWDSGRSC